MKKKLFFVVFLAIITIVNAHAGVISMTSESSVSGSTGINDSVSSVIDSNNRQHLVWTYSTSGVDGIPYYTSSSDSGATWSTKVAMTDEGISMDLVTSSDGTSIYTLYTGNLTGTLRLYFNKSTDSGATFPIANEIQFSDSKNALTAQLAMDSKGYLYAVWHSDSGSNGFDIYFTYSSDSGATFSTPKIINVEDPLLDQINPSILVDSNGVLYVTWLDLDDDQVYMMVSSNSGTSFGNGYTSDKQIQVTFPGASSFEIEDYHAQVYPGLGISIAYVENITKKVYFNRQKVMPDGTVYFNETDNKLVGAYNTNFTALIKTRLIFNGEGTVYCLYTTDDGVATPRVAMYYSTDLVEFNELTYISDAIPSVNFAYTTSYSCTNDLFFDSYGDLFINYLYINSSSNYTVKSMKMVFAFPDDKITGTVADGETDVDPTATFSFTFNDDLLSTSMTYSNIKLLDETGGLVSTYISYSYGNSTTILIDPNSSLLNGTHYEFRFVSKKVNYQNGLQNQSGIGFNNGQDLVIKFKTTETLQTAFTTFKAYPNPVISGSVQIRFKSGFALDSTETKVEIYNVNEEKVKSISSWTDHGSNEYSTTWDTTNYDLVDVTSGVYYYRVTAWNLSDTNRIQETGKILIIR